MGIFTVLVISLAVYRVGQASLFYEAKYLSQMTYHPSQCSPDVLVRGRLRCAVQCESAASCLFFHTQGSDCYLCSWEAPGDDSVDLSLNAVVYEKLGVPPTIPTQCSFGTLGQVGSTSFDMESDFLAANGLVTGIRVFHGSCVYGLQIRFGAEWTELIGETSQESDELYLSPTQYVTSLEIVRDSYRIREVTVHFNDGTYFGPYGRDEGSRNSVSLNGLFYFTGSYDSTSVTQITVWSTCN